MNHSYNDYEPFYSIRIPLFLEYIDSLEDEALIISFTPQGKTIHLSELIIELDSFIKNNGINNIKNIVLLDKNKLCREDLKKDLKLNLSTRYPNITINKL